MRVVRAMLAAVGVAGAAACGSDVLEPGTLTITLTGPPPAVTNQGSVQLTGQVIRTPAASSVVIVVTATGGSSAVTDTSAADGSFVLTVGLSRNGANQIQISAMDGSGSTGPPASVTIRHDDTRPAVASSTPTDQADGVTAGSLAVVFNEPVRPGTVTIGVSQQGVPVAGTTSLSADSLTATFTPATPLAPNSIHDMVVDGAQDEAGNAAVLTKRCFITGGPAIASVADPEDDYFVTDPPPAAGQVPIDLLEMRFARTASLHLLARFDAPRSLVLSASNNVTGVIDFDMDQDGLTGVIPLKDQVLGVAIGDSSGAGADYLIELGDWIGTDSAFVGQYVSESSVSGVAFTASACGAFVGWVVPLELLGGADDAFDVVAYFDTFDASFNLYADGAPDLGVYTITFAAAAGPPVVFARAAAPTQFRERRVGRLLRRDHR